MSVRRKGRQWMPTSEQALANLQLYGQLVAQGATRAHISWALSVGERQVQRYAAAWRALQEQQEQGTQ